VGERTYKLFVEDVFDVDVRVQIRAEGYKPTASFKYSKTASKLAPNSMQVPPYTGHSKDVRKEVGQPAEILGTGRGMRFCHTSFGISPAKPLQNGFTPVLRRLLR